MPSKKAKVLDKKIIHSHQLIGDDILKTLLSIFIEESPSSIEKIKKAAESKDQLTLRLVSHAFKGTTAIIGATALSKSCEAIQKKAESDSLSEIEKLITRMEKDYKEVCRAIRKEIKNCE